MQIWNITMNKSELLYLQICYGQTSNALILSLVNVKDIKPVHTFHEIYKFSDQLKLIMKYLIFSLYLLWSFLCFKYFFQKKNYNDGFFHQFYPANTSKVIQCDTPN